MLFVLLCLKRSILINECCSNHWSKTNKPIERNFCKWCVSIPKSVVRSKSYAMDEYNRNRNETNCILFML